MMMSASVMATALYVSRGSLALQSGTAIDLSVGLSIEINGSLSTMVMMATMSTTTMMTTASFFAAWWGLAFQSGATIHLSTDLSVGVQGALAAVMMVTVMSTAVVATAALFAAGGSLTLQSLSIDLSIDLGIGVYILALLMVPFAISAVMTVMMATSMFMAFLSARFILLGLSFQPGLAIGVHIGLAIDSDLSILTLSLVMAVMVPAAVMAFLPFLLTRFILSLSFQQTFNYWIFLFRRSRG